MPPSCVCCVSWQRRAPVLPWSLALPGLSAETQELAGMPPTRERNLRRWQWQATAR